MKQDIQERASCVLLARNHIDSALESLKQAETIAVKSGKKDYAENVYGELVDALAQIGLDLDEESDYLLECENF
jgi:hypothetical protein